jgi:phospholipid/cholesterol/gamma-HCH transport system substrate-binding protein
MEAKPVATASPPTPPGPLTPPPPPDPPASAGRRQATSRPGAGRALAIGALAAVAIAVALLVLSGGGGGADYQLIFPEAGQLVRGDQVQVGGVPVGSVKDIVLTPDFKARITIHVESSLTPLHEGTTTEIRVPSIGSVANRYIALAPGPNNRPALAAGATLPASATRPVTDLDQLLNTFNPRTRRALQQVLQGSGEQYAGAGKVFAQNVKYFGPSFAALDHVFAELVRDQATFTHFLVETAKATTTIGAHGPQLADLVENANTAFGAIGSRQASLAQALHELPGTLRQGNRTFADLPATASALKTLFNVSKPAAQPTATLFAKLRPLFTKLTPVVGNVSQAFSRPGPNNDLTDAIRALPALASALSTASPNGVASLRESVPITAFFGPYAPDLVGTLRTFGGTTAYYDANGHYARFSPVAPAFKLGANNNLTPASAQQGLEGLQTGQLRRCPGAATQPAADGSAPFTDNGLLTCDPTETPK